jgi:hydroxyquinol 1,2-dioxygenase
MRNTTEHNISALATERYGTTPDPRLRKVVTSLVKHLHAFIREIEPTEAEWTKGVEFLTSVGQTCDEKRQEFILMSDVLGVSILVDAINHRLPAAATPTTVVGPFHIHDSPEFKNGENMAAGAPGVPLVLTGTVRTLEGRPIQNAAVDVWQPDGEGLYEAQRPEKQGAYLRAVYRTDREGRYLIRTVAPIGYSIPLDGPVGHLITRTGVSPYRPTHVHFDVSADGYQSVVTHIFKSGDPHLDDDAVFAVKDRLIVDFAEHGPGASPNGEWMSVPYLTANYDFILAPAAAAAKSAA